MKKRGKKLAFMAVILLAFMGGTLLAMRLNPETEITETEEDTQITSEKIMDFERDDIDSISWTVGEQTLDFHLNNDNWVYDEDESFPVNQGTLTTLISRMIDLSSYNVIEDVSDFAEYGLDEPACTIELNGNVEIQVLLGDTTPMDGLRYVSIGNGNVYMVESSLFNEYNVNLLDLMEQEQIPIMNDPLTVEISIDSSQLVLECREVVVKSENKEETEETVELQWFSISADSETQLDSNLALNLYDSISSLIWEGNAAYNVSEEELSLYGLDVPSATLTIFYTNTDGILDVFSAEFSSTEDGSCYARLSGSDRVYSINSSYLDTLLNANTDSLLPVSEDSE